MRSARTQLAFRVGHDTFHAAGSIEFVQGALAQWLALRAAERNSSTSSKEAGQAAAKPSSLDLRTEIRS